MAGTVENDPKLAQVPTAQDTRDAMPGHHAAMRVRECND
jgi:hypothetical protein